MSITMKNCKKKLERTMPPQPLDDTHSLNKNVTLTPMIAVIKTN